MMTDPIADMLTRLRNASIASLDRTEMPLSKLKLNIAKILKEEGYVSDYEVGERHLTVFLKYGRDDERQVGDRIDRFRPVRRIGPLAIAVNRPCPVHALPYPVSGALGRHE